jgi:tRNA (guanine37-N1)-methyltransferase
MFTGPLTESLLKKAQEKKLLKINVHDIRSFTTDKHKAVDDRPFGGGPGMVFKPEPVYRALKSVGAAKSRKLAEWPKDKTKPFAIYLSPQGKTLNQDVAKRLSAYKHLVLLCGHYEGVDERVLGWVNQEISIGDYVLTGGELPALVLVDTVSRFVSGVVKEEESVQRDSFSDGLLDYPHYTRPNEFMGFKVPDVLLSGDHKKVEEWRKKIAMEKTLEKRPDLLKNKAKLHK